MSTVGLSVFKTSVTSLTFHMVCCMCVVANSIISVQKEW